VYYINGDRSFNDGNSPMFSNIIKLIFYVITPCTFMHSGNDKLYAKSDEVKIRKTHLYALFETLT